MNTAVSLLEEKTLASFFPSIAVVLNGQRWIYGILKILSGERGQIPTSYTKRWLTVFTFSRYLMSYL